MGDYLIATASMIGGRTENQDCFRAEETGYGLLAVVCDGMGGENGGRIAAELSVKVIFEVVSEPAGIVPRQVVINAISKANETVFTEGRRTPGLWGMGTTITALLINEKHALSFHVGDSRIYQFRDGEKLFRTFDHSMVFELVSSGILTEEEARISPQSNIITRALGTHPRIDVSVSDELPYEKGDRFLLCTDGIWGALSEAELTKMVSLREPISDVLYSLLIFIDSLSIEKGGMHDNMTGVLIEMQVSSV